MVLDNGRGTGDYGNIQRVAMLSVHTSPIATLGGKDAGGMNVYVRDLSRQLGRRGIAVEMPTRRSRVDALDVIAYSNNVVRLDLRVSSGTYVRAMADVLGGHCRTLRRLEVGPFSVDEADENRMIAPGEALARLP